MCFGERSLGTLTIESGVAQKRYKMASVFLLKQTLIEMYYEFDAPRHS